MTSLGERVGNRIRALPGTLADAWDAVFPGPFAELFKRAGPYSMAGRARLRSLYRAVSHVVKAEIPGDIVECGTARGGSAALMGLALERLGAKRRLWVFDTFEGMPPPSDPDPDREIAEQYIGTCRGDLADVEGLFRSLGIHDRATFVKGLFQDTLPKTTLGPIALLHLDGDWYDSVMTCFEHLYPQVSPGGIIQVDDYGHWEGARKATDEFLGRHAPGVRLRYVDYAGRQVTKPVPPQ